MVCALYSSPCPINYLNDSRTAHKVESLRLRRSLLQYVTRMAHFDLVEIKLHSIDRELFSRLYLISADPLWSFKNLCDSIYGMEMKPPLERWRRQKGKKSMRSGWRRHNEISFAISRGQYIFKYYAFRNLFFHSRMSILGNRSPFSA